MTWAILLACSVKSCDSDSRARVAAPLRDANRRDDDRSRRAAGRARIRLFDYWVPPGSTSRAAPSCACISRGARSSAWSSPSATTTDVAARQAAADRRSRRRRCRRCRRTCSRWRDSSSRYYQEPLGQVLAQMLPLALREERECARTARRARARRSERRARAGTRSTRPAAARRCDRSPPRGAFAPFLLHGVTGSGKTEVYLAAAAAAASRPAGRCCCWCRRSTSRRSSSSASRRRCPARAR